MFKKFLSVLLSVMMIVSVLSVAVVTTSAAELASTKLYFDTDGSGWDVGKNKIGFYVFSLTTGEKDTLPWGTKKLNGTLVKGESTLWEYDPAAKGMNLKDGEQYAIIFTCGSIETYSLLFDTSCMGHVAHAVELYYENPVDSSKKSQVTFWDDLDAATYGPRLQISSTGKVIGTCVEAGKTAESIFTDFLTSDGAQGLANAREFSGLDDQTLFDGGSGAVDLNGNPVLGTAEGLGLTKDQVKAAIENTGVETTWDYSKSTLSGAAHEHTPGEAVRENEKAATCTEEGSYDEVVYCTECNEEISREAKTIEKIAHTPGEAVRENEIAASCDKEGSYDEVVKCSVCGEELSRETKTIDKTAHTPGEAVRENEKPATCTAEGSYDEVVKCSVCGEELSRETKTIDKIAHTPGEAVRENEKPATCTAEGSYDEVVKCSVCGEELSRETKTIDKIAHTLEAVAEVPATEKATGVKAHYICTVCGTLFEDALGLKEVTEADLVIPMLDHTHTPGEVVRENEKAATCTEEGSYDEVVYCTECGEEISRETKTIEKIAHTPGSAVQENYVAPDCETEGSYDDVVKCEVCGEALEVNHVVVPALGHDIVFVDEKPATAVDNGVKAHYECTRCGKLYADEEGTVEVTLADLTIEADHVRGNADKKDGVDANDATWIQRYLVDLVDEADIDMVAADADRDGFVDIIDATLIQRVVIKMTTFEKWDEAHAAL